LCIFLLLLFVFLTLILIIVRSIFGNFQSSCIFFSASSLNTSTIFSPFQLMDQDWNIYDFKRLWQPNTAIRSRSRRKINGSMRSQLKTVFTLEIFCISRLMWMKYLKLSFYGYYHRVNYLIQPDRWYLCALITIILRAPTQSRYCRRSYCIFIDGESCQSIDISIRQSCAQWTVRLTTYTECLLSLFVVFSSN
jgi:hypothetical protein